MLPLKRIDLPTPVGLATLALAVGLILAAALPAVTRANPSTSVTSTLGWTVTGSRIEVLTPGFSGSPDSVRVFQPDVIRMSNGTYRMYYTGYDGFRNRILAAWSHDGIAWTRLSGSIFLNDGAGSPFVLASGAGYRMWFESVIWGPGPLGYTDRIYGATSTDGINWTITGVVVDVGDAFAWDGGSVGDPSVVRAQNGSYLMFFSMYAANRSVSIGIATSTDLVTFTKYAGNPVLLPGAFGRWDDFSVSNPSAVVGAEWSLFYEGRRSATNGQVGLAVSSDGYHWTAGANPFLAFGVPGSWDSAGTGGPAFVDSGSVRLYYDGGNGSGANGIGMVYLDATGSGTSGLILGLLPSVLVLLVATIAGVVALGLVALLVLRRRDRRRPG